jgi:Putative transmembrane protein 170
LLWTLIIFGAFHIAAAALAICMQLGKGKSAWKYVWIIPIIYAAIAGIEAILAGSFVGLMYVEFWIIMQQLLT